jgi:hypothetical protein
MPRVWSTTPWAHIRTRLGLSLGTRNAHATSVDKTLVQQSARPGVSRTEPHQPPTPPPPHTHTHNAGPASGWKAPGKVWSQ